MRRADDLACALGPEVAAGRIPIARPANCNRSALVLMWLPPGTNGAEATGGDAKRRLLPNASNGGETDGALELPRRTPALAVRCCLDETAAKVDATETGAGSKSSPNRVAETLMECKAVPSGSDVRDEERR